MTISGINFRGNLFTASLVALIASIWIFFSMASSNYPENEI